MAKKVLIETEAAGLFRDSSTMAIINNDKASYAAYKMKRQEGNKVNTLSTDCLLYTSDAADE